MYGPERLIDNGLFKVHIYLYDCHLAKSILRHSILDSYVFAGNNIKIGIVCGRSIHDIFSKNQVGKKFIWQKKIFVILDGWRLPVTISTDSHPGHSYHLSISYLNSRTVYFYFILFAKIFWTWLILPLQHVFSSFSRHCILGYLTLLITS